jgi:hypothetical protein
MPYYNHFQHADDVVNHLNTLVPAITDPLLVSKYVGFVSVVAVTVYEQAIKEIFIDFARKKNLVFGNFIEVYFSRINGHIKIKEVKDDYISKFGEKYKLRFSRQLEIKSLKFLRSTHRDIKSSYSNIITWRNDFAHEGRINATTTYNEVIQSYLDGKEIIHCLAKSMNR